MEQVKKCVDAGAEIVRITVQGKREAAACMDIREALFKDKWVAALLWLVPFHLKDVSEPDLMGCLEHYGL